MEKLNLGKNNLRKFGITLGLAFLIITLLLVARHEHSLSPFLISIIFFVLAFIMPILLKPIYIIWMRLAFMLGWINTRLILFIIFYLVFTPIGILMRLFRVDSLDKKIDKNKESYWRRKEKGDSSLLTCGRQF